MLNPMKRISFIKMHALGNDMVLFTESHILSKEMIQKIGDRHRGIGADQIIVLDQSASPVKVSFYNQDGSEAKACGNGTRCVIAYLVQYRDYPRNMWIPLEGPVGPLQGLWRSEQAIEIVQGEASWLQDIPTPWGLGHEIVIGNPHLVFLREDLLGDMAECAASFPDHNISWVQKKDDGYHARIMERGAGETLACGSAACAIHRALAPIETWIDVVMPGGFLNVYRDSNHRMIHCGPANFVFEGDFFIQ